MLNEGQSLGLIADNLLLKSASRKIKYKDLSEISQFFVLSGLHKDLFRQYARRFFEKEHIAWPHFVEILLHHKIEIPPEVTEAIYKGSLKTKRQDFLALHKKWQSYDIRFQAIREKIWESKLADLEKLRHSLIQKIEFLKNHRLIDEENKAFLKYLEIFPTDERIHRLYSDFKERQARQLITKKIEEQKNRETSFTITDSIDEKEDIYSKFLSEFLIKELKEKPLLAYNFSIMFCFFEEYEQALRILDFYPEKNSVFWLKLELLVFANNYLLVLSECERWEVEQSTSSIDERLAVIYTKAKAYKALKQRAQAVEQFKSILKIRPQYRSAQTLLNEILEENL